MNSIRLDAVWIVSILCITSTCGKQIINTMSRGTGCPEMNPHLCVCEDNKVGVFQLRTLKCNNFDSPSQLMTEMDKLRGLKFDTMEFDDGKLAPYPAGLFKDIESTHIYFTNIELDETFNLSEERQLVETVEGVYWNRITGLDLLENAWPKVFGDFWFLHQLRIENSPMKRLPMNFNSVGFEGSKLTVISLNDNSIQCIDDLALATFGKASEINLRNNNLMEIHRKMLPICIKDSRNQTCQLETLDLRNNRITHLPIDLFDDFPLLNRVIVNENNLMTIPKELVLRSSAKNLLLTLSENPIECECGLRWILEKQHPALKVIGRCKGIRYYTITEMIRKKCH